MARWSGSSNAKGKAGLRRSSARLLLPLCLAGLAAGAAGLAVASPSPPQPAWPPMTYRLNDVKVSLVRGGAHGLAPLRVELSGTGEGVFERQSPPAAFRLSREAVVTVINDLYRLRFFDLPSELPAPRSVFPRDDGTVSTQAAQSHDALQTTVCFTVGGFRKCVEYRSGAPRDLEEFVTRVFADAEKLSRPAGGAGSRGK